MQGAAFISVNTEGHTALPSRATDPIQGHLRGPVPSMAVRSRLKGRL